MQEARCEHCKYWEKMKTGILDGVCHRYPLYIAGAKSTLTHEYNRITIKSYDWCGEFVKSDKSK